MIKKILALLTALTICNAAFCGCSDNGGDENVSSSADTSDAVTDVDSAAGDESAAEEPEVKPVVPKLTIDGKEMDTDGLVMLTINGRDIDFDTFRYYYFSTVSQLTQNYGATLDTIRETENGFESLLEMVVTNIKQDHVTYVLAEENGIELTEEDIADNQATYDGIKENAGSESNYETMLRQGYLTDQVVKNMIEHAALYSRTADLFVNDGKYATSKEDFREIVKDPEVYACVRSILIPYSAKAEITDADTKSAYDGYSLSEKMSAKNAAYSALSEEEQAKVKADSEALAKEIAERASNGEDFEALLTEYGWDPGMESHPEGYYMTHDTSFVPEFLEASFALAEGETVSEPVVSDSYGWFIIKRMPIDMDYVEENMDTMIQDYDLPSRQQVYIDIMDKMKVTYSDAYKKLTIDSIE